MALVAIAVLAGLIALGTAGADAQNATAPGGGYGLHCSMEAPCTQVPQCFSSYEPRSCAVHPHDSRCVTCALPGPCAACYDGFDFQALWRMDTDALVAHLRFLGVADATLRAVRAHGVNGYALVEAVIKDDTAAALDAMQLPVIEKLRLVRLAQLEIEWLRSRPLETQAVHTFVEVVNVIGIDEAAFEYRLHLLILLSWHDSSLATPCGNLDTTSQHPFCSVYWRPELSFLSARDVVYHRKHFAVVDYDSLAGYGVGAAERAAYSLTDTSILVLSVSATFNSEMAFSSFPFDRQQLRFRFTDFHNSVGFRLCRPRRWAGRSSRRPRTTSSTSSPAGPS